MHTKLLVITGIVISQSAWADLTPKSHIGFAGIDFLGKVAVDYGYNDNVSYQPHSNDAIGSSFQSAAPVLSMIGERGQDDARADRRRKRAFAGTHFRLVL